MRERLSVKAAVICSNILDIKTEAQTNRLWGQGSLELIALDELLPSIIGYFIIKAVVPLMEGDTDLTKDFPAGDINGPLLSCAQREPNTLHMLFYSFYF